VTTAVDGAIGLEKYAYYMKNTKNVEKVVARSTLGTTRRSRMPSLSPFSSWKPTRNLPSMSAIERVCQGQVYRQEESEHHDQRRVAFVQGGYRTYGQRCQEVEEDDKLHLNMAVTDMLSFGYVRMPGCQGINCVCLFRFIHCV